MNPDLKITIIQTELFWEQKEKNLEKFSKIISELDGETDIIILPEMFTTGFTMNASSLFETMDGPAVSWMQKTANEKNCVITGSLIIKENNKYFNRLIWMAPEGFQYYDKRHLFSLAEEEKTFSRGEVKMIVTVKGWKVLPLICYDLRFPLWSRRSPIGDYDLLLYVANWPERRIYAWKQLLIARAIENQSFVAGVNRTGNDGNDIYYSGDSAMIDFKGELINPLMASDNFATTYTLSYSDLTQFRKQFPFYNDADQFEIKF